MNHVIRVVCRISRIALAHAYVIPAYHFHMWPLKSLFANSHKCSDSILLYTCRHACRVGRDRNQSFCDMKNEWSLKLKLICIFNEDEKTTNSVATREELEEDEKQVFRKCTRPSTSWTQTFTLCGEYKYPRTLPLYYPTVFSRKNSPKNI